MQEKIGKNESIDVPRTYLISNSGCVRAKSVAVLCCGVATSEDLQELEAERASNCVRLKVIKWWKCLRDGIERRSIINIMILLRDIQGHLVFRNES